MKHDFLKYLICPETGETLELEIHEEQGGQIKEGRLTSSKGDHIYPIINYVPRFVETDKYTDSFSTQRLYVRRHFKHYLRDTSGFSSFYLTTGFTKERISRGLTLEIGCGYGRFMDVVHREGGEIVGIDLSTHSVDLAQSFIGMKPNVHLVQCDLFKLPFRKGSFDSIYSIGVLHHTPDCKKAFQALPAYLSYGGQISIWVYHPSNQMDIVKWRQFTCKWPPSALYLWCIINQVLFSWVRTIPVIRWKFNRLIPGSVPKPGQHFWLRVLEDFDNLSPKYASSHTPSEVVEWYREAGLSDIKILNRHTAVIGFRR
jgi:SAM-dependent methyltransferase